MRAAVEGGEGQIERRALLVYERWTLVIPQGIVVMEFRLSIGVVLTLWCCCCERVLREKTSVSNHVDPPANALTWQRCIDGDEALTDRRHRVKRVNIIMKQASAQDQLLNKVNTDSERSSPASPAFHLLSLIPSTTRVHLKTSDNALQVMEAASKSCARVILHESSTPTAQANRRDYPAIQLEKSGI